MSGATYEPRVILEHAHRLTRRAGSVRLTSAIIGAVIGGLLGAEPFTSFRAVWLIPSQFRIEALVVGLLFGGLAGYAIGNARGFGYRLHAQNSLCQLQLERNTAALLSLSYVNVRHSTPRGPELETAVTLEAPPAESSLPSGPT